MEYESSTAVLSQLWPCVKASVGAAVGWVRCRQTSHLRLKRDSTEPLVEVESLALGDGHRQHLHGQQWPGSAVGHASWLRRRFCVRASNASGNPVHAARNLCSDETLAPSGRFG